MSNPGRESLDELVIHEDADRQPVVARWVRSRANLKAYLEHGAIKGLIDLSLAPDSTLEGMLYIPDSRSSRIEMVMSEPSTNPERSEEDASRRLISALGHIAKQNQAAVLLGQPESQDTVTAVAEVFGEDNLGYATHPGEPWSRDLWMTTAEAISLFDAGQQSWQAGFGFVVDLGRVPIDGLEVPVIT